MTVDFENDEYAFPFDETELIGTLVNETFRQLACPYEVYVSVQVVDVTTIRELNREYRNIDRETDVLSFPMNEYESPGKFSGDIFDRSMSIDPETGELLLGDIVLCAERICSQAKEYGHSQKREYAFLVVHSLLHLSGYDHMEEDDRDAMERMQRLILDNLGIQR